MPLKTPVSTPTNSSHSPTGEDLPGLGLAAGISVPQVHSPTSSILLHPPSSSYFFLPPPTSSFLLLLLSTSYYHPQICVITITLRWNISWPFIIVPLCVLAIFVHDFFLFFLLDNHQYENEKWTWSAHQIGIINSRGVARAVLQSPLSLIDSLIHSFINSVIVFLQTFKTSLHPNQKS